MPRKTATRQVWECPTCQFSYHSPISVKQVLCPKKHLKTREMKLVRDNTQPE